MDIGTDHLTGNHVLGTNKAERRSKVLITKLLQKVVSGIPYSADSDSAMFPCNSFILEKRGEVRDMLLRVCDVSQGAAEYTAGNQSETGMDGDEIRSPFLGMEEAVAHDLGAIQDQKGLHVGEALRTVRSLLVQNYRCIDSGFPPIAFVLQNKFRESLNMPRSRKGSKNRSTSGSSNDTAGMNSNRDKHHVSERSAGGKGVSSDKKRRKRKKNGGAHGRQRAPTVHDVAAKNRHQRRMENVHRVTISGGRIV